MKKQKNQVSVVLISFICLVFVNCLVNCNETIDPTPAKQGATPTPTPTPTTAISAESQPTPAAPKPEAPMVKPLAEEEIALLHYSFYVTEKDSNNFTVMFNPDCYDLKNKLTCVNAVARAVSVFTGGSATCLSTPFFWTRKLHIYSFYV